MFKKLFSREKTTILPVDPEILSPEGLRLEKGLLQRVVGQDRAVRKLVRVWQTFQTGLQEPGKPLANLLFLGPTGSGKTRMVEALAEVLLGSKKAMMRIDCAEFELDHDIAKLIGSPPGYIGHDKTAPRFTPEAFVRHHRPDCKITIVLFDEIEKGSRSLQQLLLGMMEGRLTTNTNQSIDLSNTIIFMTSNIGSDDIQKLCTGDGVIGFTGNDFKPMQLDMEIWKTAKEAIKRKFSAEFINRLTKSIVFHQLTPEQLRKIVEIELSNIQDRLLLGDHFILLKVSPEAKDLITKEGTDPVYGARELKRTIERYITEPAASLISTRQVSSRDMLMVEVEDGKIVFRKMEGVVDPPAHFEEEY